MSYNHQISRFFRHSIYSAIYLSLVVTVVFFTGTANSAVVDFNARWDQPFRNRNIPVCIVNPDAIDAEVRNDIETHINAEFAKTRSVRLTSWGKCESGDYNKTNIRVYLGQMTPGACAGAHVTGILGRSHIGPNSSGLNYKPIGRRDDPGEGETLWFFAPTSWPTAVSCKSRIYSTALHEFGHAIGLLHEQGRQDRLDRCNRPEQQIDGVLRNNGTLAMYIGDYESGSIMESCRDRVAKSAFSKETVYAIDLLYHPQDCKKFGSTFAAILEGTPSFKSWEKEAKWGEGACYKQNKNKAAQYVDKALYVVGGWNCSKIVKWYEKFTRTFGVYNKLDVGGH